MPSIIAQPKKLNQSSTESTTAELCPKCLNLLSCAGMQETNRGWQLVYDCPECNCSYAFVPVTQMQLFEVIPQ